MSPDGYPRAPKVIPGAFIQLIDDIVGVLPNVITFQYNPEAIARSLEPWNPFEVDQTERGAQSPTVQPYNPNEKLTFTLDFHAGDGMEIGNPLALASGVLPQMAALQKLVQPTEGLLGDLVASAKALAGGGGAAQTERSSVPITLLVLGPGLIYPVRVASLSFEQKEFNPLLYPIHVMVAVELVVLTPDTFKCRTTPATEVAIGCYNFTKTQENALAVANIVSSVMNLPGPVPF